MKTFSAKGTIQASPERIWEIITDAPNFPVWEPTVDRIEGTIAKGNKITAYSKLAPGRGFPVTVTVFEPGKQMVWGSGMPFGLFKGERTFTIKERGDGGVDFSVQEVFSGILLPLIGRTLPDLDAAFQQFVDGLKAHAEKPA